MREDELTGDQLARILGTLANPHRLRVIAVLESGRGYVSELARELGISRPLLQVHLRKFEAAGPVSAQLEVSDDGKAMTFYAVTPFTLRLTPPTIAAVARTLTQDGESQGGNRERAPRRSGSSAFWGSSCCGRWPRG